MGLVFFAVFFAWVSTADTATSYLEIVGQMLLGGSGVGLVSAPATEAIMGVVPKAKAGIGSAVNDATRLLGSTLGIAVIGSIYVSLYNNRLSDKLPATLTPQDARTAHDSVGRAFDVLGDDEVGERDSVAQRRKACHGRVPPWWPTVIRTRGRG